MWYSYEWKNTTWENQALGEAFFFSFMFATGLLSFNVSVVYPTYINTEIEFNFMKAFELVS